jgi:hypothetical protein
MSPACFSLLLLYSSVRFSGVGVVGAIHVKHNLPGTMVFSGMFSLWGETDIMN